MAGVVLLTGGHLRDTWRLAVQEIFLNFTSFHVEICWDPPALYNGIDYIEIKKYIIELFRTWNSFLSPAWLIFYHKFGTGAGTWMLFYQYYEIELRK